MTLTVEKSAGPRLTVNLNWIFGLIVVAGFGYIFHDLTGAIQANTSTLGGIADSVAGLETSMAVVETRVDSLIAKDYMTRAQVDAILATNAPWASERHEVIKRLDAIQLQASQLADRNVNLSARLRALEEREGDQ